MTYPAVLWYSCCVADAEYGIVKDYFRMKGIYLGLGSNLGDRLGNLHRAAEALPPSVSILAASPVYETDPWGYLDQPAFLNQVWEVATALPAKELLLALKKIERKIGRKVTFQNGPRVIDLDILFYGDLLLEQDGISIPHPRLHERAFVLVPLADLAPGLVHPSFGKTVRELLQSVDQQGVHYFL
jgi:2-amino-4-hydroxy-6-hydroxymethyldihydropteridine diphosphokinase